jgi:hypothetical protein
MKQSSGNITAQNQNPASGTATAGSAVELRDLADEGVALVQVSGTYTGALQAQIRVNGKDWFDVPVIDAATGVGADDIASAATGVWRIDIAAAEAVRIGANAEAITGSAFVALRAGQRSSAATEVSVNLQNSDVQIGAVEVKDATTDNRQSVAADGRAATDANLQVGNADAPGGAGAVTASTPRVTLANDVNLPQHALRATTRFSEARINNAAASGDATVVAAVAGQTTRVHALRLSVAAATIVQVKRGATILEVFNFAGNGGAVVLDLSEDPHYITAANEAFVINSSAAVQVDGRAYYVTSA